MTFESPFAFKKPAFEPAPRSEPESEAYQAVSSSGMEQVIPSSDSLERLFDDDVERVSFAETDVAPDTSRDFEEMDSEPSTLRSQEVVSGIRAKGHQGDEGAMGVEVDEILDPGQTNSMYEISVQGTIKTPGDRNLPPFAPSSIHPDGEQNQKNGRKAA